LIRTLQQLDQRCWNNKRWQTRKGHERGGLPFTKTSLRRLLTNVVYLGKVKYKREVHNGEHAGIVDRKVFLQVQETMKSHAGTNRRRQHSNALLKGLLHCRPCRRVMTPTYAWKKGGRRYGYYVCTNALKRGRQACPSGSLNIETVEQWVVEQVQKVAAETLPFDRRKGSGPYKALSQWESLSAQARAGLLHSWIERVDYDGAARKAAITFCPGD
jgi:site-specific DNA recombinase